MILSFRDNTQIRRNVFLNNKTAEEKFGTTLKEMDSLFEQNSVTYSLHAFLLLTIFKLYSVMDYSQAQGSSLTGCRTKSSFIYVR